MTREEIINQLVKEHGWDRGVVELGIRAGFRCEYCGVDMLASVDNYFYNWNNDHIEPASKDGKWEPDNMAVSCKTCNFMKGNRDLPRPASARDEKIAVWQEWIRNRRTEKQTQLARIRSLCTALLTADESVD